MGICGRRPVKNPVTSDVVSFTFPMQMLAVDMWKSGQIPLWNPYIFAGTPLLANFQSAALSFTKLLYFIFDKLTAWSIEIILQHILAAIFTYFLLRHWKISKLGAIFGGVIFAFSGFNLIWSQWNGHSLAAAFIPLGILFTDKWLVGGRWMSGAMISVCLALVFLSGYPQIALYLFVALGLLWIFRIVRNKHFFFQTILMGIFLLIGLGLAAPQILPGSELLKYSQRGNEIVPFEWVFLPFSKIITFIAPDYFGNHSTGNYWGPQNYTSNSGFVGVVAFSLAIFGLSVLKKNREAKYAVVLLITSLILALPTPVSIFIWRSKIFALNAAFADRALVLFDLSIAILAAFGTEYIIQSKKLVTVGLIFPGFILTGFGGYALIRFLLSKYQVQNFSPLVNNIPAYSVALRNLVWPAAIYLILMTVIFIAKRIDIKKRIYITIILFLLLLSELFRFGWKFTTFSPRSIVFPETPVISFIKKQQKPVRITGSYIISVDMRMSYKIESFEGYDAVYPSRIAKLIAVINTGKNTEQTAGQHGIVDNMTSPLLDLLNTKYYLSLKKNSKGDIDVKGKVSPIFSNERFSNAFADGSVAVLESNSSLSRAFVVYDWENPKSDEEMLNALASKSFPYEKEVFIEDYPNKPTADAGVYKIEYEKYQENESVIKVTSTKPGLLFISDTYYPGWQAFVDGTKTPIYRADFAFRAIPLSAGTHKVQMIYMPASFIKGLKLAAASLVVLFLMIFGVKMFRIKKT